MCRVLALNVDSFLRANNDEGKQDAAFEAQLENWRLSGREAVQTHWREFSELARRGELLTDNGRYASAVAAAQTAANFAVLWHPGVYASPILDQTLARLGRSAIPTDGAARYATTSPSSVLHVATQVSAIGGHSRMIARWIGRDGARVHSLALTRQAWPVPEDLVNAVAKAGGEIRFVNCCAGGPLAWASGLQSIMKRHDLIVLHVHNQDVVPFVALGGMRRRPRVLLLDHADHLFWLGAGSVDLVINTRLSGRDLCVRRRGVPVDQLAPLPLCLDRVARDLDRPAARRALGLPEESVMLLTVARATKFRPVAGRTYADAFVPLLLRHPEAHLVAVGPGGSEDWTAAQSQVPGRIHSFSETPNTRHFYEAADIYVDSFPFMSNTSILQAGQYGMPVVTRYFFGKGCDIMGADSIGMDANLVRTIDPHDFERRLGLLIENETLRKDLGGRTRAGLESINAGADWNAALAEVYARAGQISQRSAPAATDETPRTDDIDAFAPFVFGPTEAASSAGLRLAQAQELALTTVPPLERASILASLTVRRHFVYRPLHAAWRYLIPEWIAVQLRGYERRARGDASALPIRPMLAPAEQVFSEPKPPEPVALFCGNERYFQHMAVAIVSLAASTRARLIHIHVLTCDGESEEERKLRRTAARLPNVAFRLHRVSAAQIESLFVSNHVTREAYLRFLAADILPICIDRFVYLDCDLIVLDDIAELYGMELGEKVLAAAPDFPWDPDGTERRRLVELGLPEEKTYINSGVLVVDRRRWQDAGLTARLVAFTQAHNSALRFHDQDALNVVCQNDIHVIDPRWNLQARMYLLTRRQFPVEWGETRMARRNPGVIHFTTGNKPWDLDGYVPRRRLYFHFLRRTEWANDALPKGRTAKLTYRTRRLLLRAGLDFGWLHACTTYAARKVFGHATYAVRVKHAHQSDSSQGQ